MSSRPCLDETTIARSARNPSVMLIGMVIMAVPGLVAMAIIGGLAMIMPVLIIIISSSTGSSTNSSTSIGCLGSRGCCRPAARGGFGRSGRPAGWTAEAEAGASREPWIKVLLRAYISL